MKKLIEFYRDIGEDVGWLACWYLVFMSVLLTVEAIVLPVIAGVAVYRAFFNKT